MTTASNPWGHDYPSVPIVPHDPFKLSCIRDVMNAGHRNPLIKTCLESWLCGHMTFEQAACQIIVSLADDSDKLRAIRMKRAEVAVPDPIIVNKESS